MDDELERWIGVRDLECGKGIGISNRKTEEKLQTVQVHF